MARKDNKEHVKFISYTGKYPNLCTGSLTLEIDRRRVTFGITAFDDYPSFWSTGGHCSYGGCELGEWEISIDEIPEQFRNYATEINEVFNDNVPYGCCGGCL